MFFVNCLKIISILCSIVGGTFLIPLGVAIYYDEPSTYLPLIIPMAVTLVVMLAVNIPTRKTKVKLSIRQTFAIVALSWIAISILGSFPLYFSGAYPSYTDAFFESVSGFTTTGCTVCPSVEDLPHSINMLRCLTHWLGGMGVVTLTVAMLPLLGVGGFQLIKAETTGPEKGKVTARITTTAKVLWLIYTGFTLVETALLFWAGMSFDDALAHSFSTLGTGGFSSKNASIGGFNSPAIDIIISVFMLIAGINFSLYYYLITRKFNDIFSNSEFKSYIAIVVICTIAITLCVIPVYENIGTGLRYSFFQVLAIITTTGFGTADYILWPSTAQFFLFILFFIGGCSGSTGGGFKVVRWVVLWKQFKNEVKRILHPHGVFTVRLNNKVGRKDIVFSVAAFLTAYFLLIAVTTFVGCIGKLDITTAFTGAVSMVGNVGPAFGGLGPSENYAALSGFVKYWYCFAMIAGRLELYTMILFFTPAFWKK